MATKADIDKWIAAQGGPDAVVYSYEDVEVDDPRGMRNNPDGTSNDAYDRAYTENGKPKKITVRREMWKNKTTGATYSARRVPFKDDEFDDIKETAPTTNQNPATQKPAGGREGPEGTPTGRTNPDGTPEYDNTRPRWVVRNKDGQEVYSRPLEPAERLEWEKDRNEAAGKGRYTDKELEERGRTDAGETRTEAVQGSPGWTATTTRRRNPQTGAIETTTVYNGPGGVTQSTPPEKPNTPKPEPSPSGDGTYGYWDIKPGQPPKWVPIEGGPGAAAPKVIEINGQYGYWKPGAAGAAPTWVPVNAPQAPQLPPDMPKFTPDPTKPSMGLLEYVDQLTALRSQGKLTDKQFTEYVGLAHQSATAEAQRLDHIQTQQNQATTNAISQRTTDINASLNRLSSANTATQNAFDTSLKMAGNFTPKSYAAAGGPILPAVMALQDMRAAQWGGMYQPPQVPTTPPIGQVIPAVASLVPQPAAPGVPNALGLGGGIGQPAPAAPAPDPAANAAQHMANPAFRPPPPVTGSVAMTDAPPPPANPMPGLPGNDPTQPVGMAAPPVPAVNTLGIMAELGGKYSPEVLQIAAQELGMF